MTIDDVTYAEVFRSADWSRALNPVHGIPALFTSVFGWLQVVLAIVGLVLFVTALRRHTVFVRWHCVLGGLALLAPIAALVKGMTAIHAMADMQGVQIIRDDFVVGATESVTLIGMGVLILVMNVLFLVMELSRPKPASAASPAVGAPSLA